MPKTTRTFIALAIPEPLGERLMRLQAQLAAEVASVRWTATLPFHVTLAFLGDVLDTDLNAVCNAVARAAAPFAPFEGQLRGIGAFPTLARPRVIWAGIEGPRALHDLRQAIVKALTAVGYRPDDDRFAPHTTLGRIKADRRAPQAVGIAKTLEPHRDWSGGSFTVNTVVTLASTLTPEGPAYTPLARAPLTGKTAVTP
jgi:RNA 2',3'-cyclic 3'-phosphodiesterase